MGVRLRGPEHYASESFLKLVGLTQEQCSSFGWGDVLAPMTPNGLSQPGRSASGPKGIGTSSTGIARRWSVALFLARGVPVRDEQGRIYPLVGINLDITGLKARRRPAREREPERARAADWKPSWRLRRRHFHRHDAECRSMTATAWLTICCKGRRKEPFEIRSGRREAHEFPADEGRD